MASNTNYDHYKTIPDPAEKVNYKKKKPKLIAVVDEDNCCLLYTSPSPRDLSTSRMPSSA